jgi:hypothetical protein
MINIRGVFDYLLEPSIFKLVEEEFDMYKHHARDKVDGVERRGWMRHMFYSLVQQVIRQDPGYYGLMAAARPDKNWRLISYPYYTKDTTVGDRTGFRHLDINVEELVEKGRGCNMVQGLVSLDNEDDDGCTVLVPGFHRHIGVWWQRVRERGQAGCGYTTNASKTYLAVDE